ncbi:MAG: hypothetical protein QW130_07125, partial [Sulfolobales archaeon]
AGFLAGILGAVLVGISLSLLGVLMLGLLGALLGWIIGFGGALLLSTSIAILTALGGLIGGALTS